VSPATGVGVHVALGDDLTKATGVGDVDDGHLDANSKLHEDPDGGDGARDLLSGGGQSHVCAHAQSDWAELFFGGLTLYPF
jgi:hypothetical protein